MALNVFYFYISNCFNLVEALQIGFQDVAFLFPRVSFAPHLLKIVVEMKTTGP